MSTSYSLSAPEFHRFHVLIAKIRQRSLGSGVPVQTSVGSDWTPPERRSISPWPSAWSIRPQAKTSTLPAWTPLFLTWMVEVRTAAPRYAVGRYARTSDVPRGTRTHGTRSGYAPAPPLFGVTTIAPATFTSGV